jgi:hypothetical protein
LLQNKNYFLVNSAGMIVDDIARPDEQQLGDIRQKHTGKRKREK